MGQFIAGDVVFLQFPFDDLTQAKGRPALVLGLVDRNRYLVAYITSQERQSQKGSIRLTQKDLILGALRKVSYIRPDILFTARDKIILRKVGVISPEKHESVIEKLIVFLRKGLRSAPN